MAYTPTHITTAATNTIFTGVGEIYGISVNQTAAGTITIFDGTKTLGIIVASVGVGFYEFPAEIHDSLIVTNATTNDMTVFSRKLHS